MARDNQSRILVIEDNETDSRLLTRQLARASLEDYVTVISDGREALGVLSNLEAPPLAIFLDLKLPGLSGIELLREIRLDQRLSLVPVIIMTGSNNPEDIKACNKLGVAAFLPKPISLTSFIKMVAHLFPQADATR